jgi:hypothetical protein
MHSTNVRQRKRGAPGSSLPRHDTGQLSPGADGRWYDVPSVRIERTGSQLLQECWLGLLRDLLVKQARNVVVQVTQINQIVPICKSDLIARRWSMAS